MPKKRATGMTSVACPISINNRLQLRYANFQWLFFIVVCLLAAATICPGQTISEKLNFRQLEKLILSRQDNFRAALARKTAAGEKIQSEKWDNLPEFSATYRYLTDSVDPSDDNFNASSSLILRLSHDLIQLFKIRHERINSAKAEATIADLHLQQAQQFLLLEFRKAYLDAHFNNIGIDRYRHLVEIYRQLLAIQESLYKHNESLLPQVLQAQIYVLESEGSLQYSSRQFENQKQYLEKLLAINADQIAWDLPEFEQGNFSVNKLVNAAIKNNADVSENEAKQLMENSHAAIAGNEDLQLAPYVGLRIYGNDYLPRQTSAEAGVRLSFPLFYPWSKKHKSEYFIAKSQAWQYESFATIRELVRQINDTYDKYLLLASRVKTGEKEIALNKEILRIEELKYTNPVHTQNTNNATILELKARLLKAELQRSERLSDQYKTLYELLYLSGLTWPENLQELAAGEHSQPKTNALWVWQSWNILTSSEETTSLVQYCKNNFINKVFLSVNKQVLFSPKGQDRLANLIALLHGAGIRVSALSGDSHWIVPANRQNMTDRINSVLNYNRKANANSGFDAIHLDIEPHTLPDWDKNKTVYLAELANTLRLAKQTIAGSGLSLPLETDIPVFFHKIDQPSLQEIINTADLITIMAYESNPEQIPESIQPILILAKNSNKKIIVGLNANDYQNKSELIKAQKTITNSLITNGVFWGLATHQYSDLRKMTRN